ncbi:DUF6602 domain-containing protein [Vibrio coralliilyticus]|uniref:DUF6602 domain-containing protein n=1 Tax=Vibrio coralliilyticus TaxID=190893 RepID=UPI0006CC38BC|nr:DUF6602 domain-containing protein [Vibrio coralliilyticus]AXN34607.1 hypothetical protein DVV14_25255 [Vibrio coralliilyticus]KPH25195.1 hypothetical protein ADU60_17105 [Vibrio coralliilyticus]
MTEEKHDIHDFLTSAQRDIQEEYERIMKRATEDPGTAGDQGEENWATLLKNWLPSYFHIVTKGRILCENGYASPQIDILVLHPSYPKILLDKKLYLAGGVAAAFECKTTLKASHVKEAVKTAANIRKNLPPEEGSPYKELNSKIIYGLLAHSHSWKGDNSKPVENIEKSLWEADSEFVEHPIQQLDFITVSDLATWTAHKSVYIGPAWSHYNDGLKQIYGENGSANTSYVCAAKEAEGQKEFFAPISVLLTGLFSKFAWTYNDMRGLEAYFRRVNMSGNGQGRMRLWPLAIYSKGIQSKVYSMQLSNGVSYDEWHCHF